MQPEEVYEVRVRVRGLGDATKLIQVLDAAGYKDVEMGPPRGPFPPPMASLARAFRGRLNRIVLRALCRLGAVDKEHGAEVDKIIQEMKKDADSGEFVRRAPEGVLSRTVAMVASSILAERREWVSYDPEHMPRRFWLTQKGVEEVKRRL